MLTINSRSGTYTAEFTETLGEALSRLASDVPCFVLIDQRVTDLYAADLQDLDKDCVLAITANEDSKSYADILPVFEWLIERGIRRDHRLLVIGGGVLQDIGAFVSHLLLRGIAWDFIPTTLLAQADSCIGSKSSINVGAYKNQLGTYAPPGRILIPTDVLRTLPPDEIRSGLGEIVKLHALAGEQAMVDLQAVLPDPAAPFSVLPPLIHTALTLKKRYIEEDEFDRGVRNLLNYGHTFGHAYESATRYAVPHGIAVSLGMLTALFVSEQRGMLPPEAFVAAARYLAPFYQPYETALTEAQLPLILAALQRDKKNTGGMVHCILTRGYGRMEKVPLDLERDLQPLMRQFLAMLNATPVGLERS